MGQSIMLTTVTPSSAAPPASSLAPLPGAQPSSGNQYVPNTYIFLQTSQPNIQPYFPGGAGLLQAAPAWTGGAPANPPYFNIAGMISDTGFFQNQGFKQSSNRGHNNQYKNRRGGGRGTGRDNEPRNNNQNTYNTPYGQNNYHSQPPFNNHNNGFQPRNSNSSRSHNWETSSQHSNSSQGKKYSTGSVPEAPVAVSQPAPANRVSHPPVTTTTQYQANHHQAAPRPQPPPKEVEQNQYYPNQYPAPRTPVETLQPKDFSRRGGGKGREGAPRGGLSGRGRSNEDFIPSGRGGGMMGGPPRGQNFPPRNAAQQDPAPVPVRNEVKPPEFNMETNDFPALPGSREPGGAPRRVDEDRPFIEVVKGTAKVRLEDGEEAGSEDEDVESVPNHHQPPQEDSSQKQPVARYLFDSMTFTGSFCLTRIFLSQYFRNPMS